MTKNTLRWGIRKRRKSPTIHISSKGVPYVKPKDIIQSEVGQARLHLARQIKPMLMKKKS